MNFGKNRVQYNEFLWQFLRFEKFDTYFYVNGKELAEFTAKVANEKIDFIQNYFQYTLGKRIIFIIYNKLSDFKQSNIGLISEDDQTNIGGVTKIIDNKVFLYFEGDRYKFEKQISAAITEVILNEMLFGTTFKDRLANSTLLTLPDWFRKGLISYVSDNWNYTIEDHVKDGILSGKYKKFNSLTGDDATYAGHSIWRYIALTYGEAIIPNIIYLTRVHKDAENGILYVLGISFSDLTSEWIKYYETVFGVSDPSKLPLNGQVIKKPKDYLRYQSARISQDGHYIAYTTNDLGQYKIWLYNATTGKSKRIIKREHKLDQITDYSYPLLAWHPSGKILAFINEYKGKILLNLYDVETRQMKTSELFYFDKILDFSYSDDGFSLVMSAVIKGQSDIFVHNLVAHTNEQITNDVAEDLYPRFINHSTQIIFASDRSNDTLKRTGITDTQPYKDIFIYNYKSRSDILVRITNTKFADESYPFEISKHSYSYLSDESGVVNRYLASYDSSISFIDTTIHYKYFTYTYPLTDYPRNIQEQDFNKREQLVEICRYNNTDRILLSDFDSKNFTTEKPVMTSYRKSFVRNMMKQDSLKTLKKEPEKPKFQEPPKPLINFQEVDTIVNIYNYVFEQEKKADLTKIQDKLTTQKKKFVLPSPRMYKTAFYNNYVVDQVDFSFLNASYQTFTGGAVYYNPGLNLFFKLGINDLFEDYKLTGGIRFSVNFDSNEYLLSLENLKERMDKQYIFHRQTFESYSGDTVTKVYTHEFMYVEKYPFSQVAALKFTASVRFDREVFMATDRTNLEKNDVFQNWGGLKIEYIFDNTISKGINLYNGTRYKLFFESYYKMQTISSSLYVVGLDFRHYEKIHREIIFASRLAASTSFGGSKLIYYLGSEDNWFNFSSGIPTFNSSVAIDKTQNYVYQTLATNMRGFNQNIRNGNSFVLMNNELRIPIVKYFIRRPISNDFFSNLQIVGFYDVGTAWSGPSPYSKENAYNYIYAHNGPVTVTIDRDINPIVMGYGFGIHSRLLGYFVRADWAWGIEDNVIQPRIFYLSLSLDF
ncbi:MAG: hypothetical protein NTW49_01315 [Bacteroidia bacterium]|nr:hypothetical protein [Bacteroidia bacterium]